MIDVQKVIDYYKVDKKILTLVLFPDLNNPDHAMWRVCKTSANTAMHTELTLAQAYRMAEFIGVTIDELFAVSNWKLTEVEEKPQANVALFRRGDFTVTLNLKTGISTISKIDEGVLLSERILVGDFIGMNTFFKAVDDTIENLLIKKSKTI